MSIRQALSDAADHARMHRRPSPVILTDKVTAQMLAGWLANEIGVPMFFDRVPMPSGVVAVYDGIEIRAKPRFRVKMGRRVVASYEQALLDLYRIGRDLRC